MRLQQGDVVIDKCKISLKEGKKLKHLVLAEGESTFHHHQIVSGVAALIMMKDKMFLKVMSDYAKLKHEEHNEIDIPKGTYEIKRVREYDHFKEESRRVQD